MAQTQNQLSPHEVLGVAVIASLPEIRAAYLREARRWHPDKRQCDETPEAKEVAHRQFIAVHTAWEKLQQSGENEVGAAPAKASFADRFKGSAEKLALYRSEREAAEEVLENLRSAALAGEWLESDSEVLREMAAKAQRTIEALWKLELFYEARVEVAKEMGFYEKLPDTAQGSSESSVKSTASTSTSSNSRDMKDDQEEILRLPEVTQDCRQMIIDGSQKEERAMVFDRAGAYPGAIGLYREAASMLAEALHMMPMSHPDTPAIELHIQEVHTRANYLESLGLQPADTPLEEMIHGANINCLSAPRLDPLSVVEEGRSVSTVVTDILWDLVTGWTD